MPKLPSVEEIKHNVMERKGISEEEWQATFNRYKERLGGLVTDQAVAVMVAQHYGVNCRGYAIGATQVEVKDISSIREADAENYVNMRIWLYWGERRETKRGNPYWRYTAMDAEGNLFGAAIYEKAGEEIAPYPDGTCIYVEKGRVRINNGRWWLNIDLGKYSTIREIKTKQPPEPVKVTTEALVNEAKEHDSKYIQVEGIVLPGSVRYNPEKGSLSFDLFDGTEYFIRVTLLPSMLSNLIKQGKMSVDYENGGLDSCKVKVTGRYVAKNTWTGQDGKVVTQEHVLRCWDMEILQRFDVEGYSTTTQEENVAQSATVSPQEASESKSAELSEDDLRANIEEMFSIADAWSEEDIRGFFEDIYGDRAEEAFNMAMRLGLVKYQGDKIVLPSEKDKAIAEEQKALEQPTQADAGEEAEGGDSSGGEEISEGDELVQLIMLKVREYETFFNDGISVDELVNETKAAHDEVVKRVEWLKEHDKLYVIDGKLRRLEA